METQTCARCHTRPRVTFEIAGIFARRVKEFIPPLCGECMDVAAEENHKCEESRLERINDTRHEARIKAAGIPPQYGDGRCADYRFDRQAVKTLAQWGREVTGVVLQGSVGVGKTTLAGIAAWRMVTQGRALRWATAPLLMARIGSGFGTSGKEWALGVVEGDCALVLDDIDKARPTEYAAELLFAAVDERISRERPLLITSNLPLGDLAARWPEPYGDAIASRLSTCKLIMLRGNDRRLAK